MKAAIRIHSLTLEGAGPKSLSSMEAHGKREDKSSKRRRIRDMAPLVHGTLDLRMAFDAHVAGCRRNAGLKRPAMHAIVQFPPELGGSARNRAQMLRLAVAFINEAHGGDAAFAARLDQDELGLATVDVFYAPRYVKEGKRRSETWISTTKHGKEIAERHRDEIMRRNKGLFSTAPRHIGIAMQAELYDFLSRHGLELVSRTEKESFDPDRLEPEVAKARQQAQAETEAAARLRAEALDAAQAVAEQQQKLEAEEAERQHLLDLAREDRHEAALALVQAQAIKATADAQHAKITVARERLAQEIEAVRAEAAREAAETAAQFMVAALTGGKISPDTPMAREIWPVIRPVMTRFTSWWRRYRERIESLPERQKRVLFGDLPQLQEGDVSAEGPKDPS